ncbi:MAG: hypothetical protein HC858_03220 [Brachymonas sp.]|nr:hypothetical protein [Brachymonas sp.]
MSDLRLIVELIDVETSCVLDELCFDGVEANTLLNSLNITTDKLATGIGYDISKGELALIREIFSINKITEKVASGYLRHRYEEDDLPYKSHTNRELLLMLRNEKPMSVFSGTYPWQSQVLIQMCEKFEPYVKQGRFVMREHLEINAQDERLSVKRIFFALPIEAWRIDAYMLMWKTAKISGWNDTLELIEGSLLGYTDEQNQIHLLRKRQLQSI